MFNPPTYAMEVTPEQQVVVDDQLLTVVCVKPLRRARRDEVRILFTDGSQQVFPALYILEGK